MNSRRIRKQVAAYGVALSALAGAEAAEGAIVNLTPNPGSVSFQGTGGQSAVIVTLGPSALSFYQFNDGVGKSLSALGAITGWRATSIGNTITTGLSFNPYVSISPSASGTAVYAFRTSDGGGGNNVGFIRVNLGGNEGTITYLDAAYEDSGAGIVATPEPGTAALFGLGLLAMGATGVQRLRRRRSQAS